MNKDKKKPTPARDKARALAVAYIAKKYRRSENWGYKVARRDSTVQNGEHFEEAYKAYRNKYQEINSIFST